VRNQVVDTNPEQCGGEGAAKKGTYPDNNPKTRFGILKPSMTKFPAAAVLYGSLAMMDGARKYGPYNWREKDVSASIYVDAAKRHIDAWYDGEQCAKDSHYPHLGHALACLAIIIDAEVNGCLIDDRPTPGKMSELIESWTATLTQIAKAREASEIKMPEVLEAPLVEEAPPEPASYDVDPRPSRAQPNNLTRRHK
jgi:hypothetical protein